ncbi:unnamed protein product [Acanthoscelides obtectus]|uniref:Uncharacterized protein n=1 Tax=Acanthoscelides obtectus TaxID=200917 RepID=A0A9P0K106_ACAOB|nr:unnamed protein product [Acanthoscelides obtectus]CAK1628747.1 Putative elongator complex protein 1 [Acanthoscelides obtectus]
MEPVFESEPSLNLGPTASFTFHGMSLACCAIELGCNKIVIFDKYGRIKEEFFVPQTKGIIKKVRFHPEPTMLAVVSEDAPEREQYITLYFKSNNRWYLKQELFYPNGIKIYDVFWQSDVFNVSKLIVVTDKYVEWHTFRVVIHRSPHDATMVVVDGRYIEFNKFDVSIKPPPCFYNRLEHIRPINQIHFNPILKQCLVIDSHCQTQVFDYSGRFVIPAYLSINPSLTSLANVAAVHWIDVCAVEIIIEANIESKITNENNGFEQTYIIKNCNAGKRGFPYRISDSLAPKHTELLARNVIRKDDYGMLTAFGVITYQFSHTSTRELFVEGKLICKDVTSYCIYKKYLFFTHMTSNMYTIRLTNAATFEHELNLERCYKRPIAQGLRILTVTDRLIPLVVLTHPRGNLESIASAMVAIDLVDEMLKAHQWGEALQLMRDQRINWNVLIELNPDRFQVCIQEFLNAVGTESFLISIVQDFDPYRVTLNTTYKNLLQSKVEVTSEEKIKIIEDILRHLIFSNPVANFFAIVAIQLKHISLLSAVKSVQRLYYRNYRKFSEMCRRAITSMLDTADVKDIIDVAYNLYDSEFVLFVYQCTNEDPKVYEREVRDLEQYMDDVSILRFHMCIKGHNPKGAIKYMLRYDGFDEALVEKFIFHNDLQKEAYKTVDPCHRNYFLIIRLYAQSLSRKRKFQEAAVVYMNAGLYKEAIEECRLGLDWREVIRLMTVLNYDESVKRDVLGKIADDLIKEKRVEEAVIVLEHHKKDYKKTIKTLMEFKSFRHAICLAVSLGLDLELRK